MSLDTILNLWNVLSQGMQGVYDILNSTLRDLLTVDVPVIKDVFAFLIKYIGNAADWTVIEFMFGVGIPFIVILSITKWVADIIP